MKLLLVLFLFLAFCGTVFAGTKEDVEQIQRNLLEIQQQFWDLEKRLKENDSLGATVKNLQDTSEDLRSLQASLNAKMEKILDEIQALNERLEETDRRVRNLSVAAPVAVNPDPADSMNPVEVRPDPPAPSPQPSMPAVNEQRVYQDAMGQYTKGKFEVALRSFQDLLDQFPGSPMSDDAQFMIGESYYGMKEYVDAVSEYDKVIKSYPDSDRVPGARLKKAFSLFSLGKKGQGVLELQQIVQRYPNTKEAEIARQRLEELGLE